jgi:uncharacterized protein (DUF1697 family)
MNTFIALFRGINVGGRNKVVMKELVSLMHGDGYKNVRTYIQSGNVVFNSDVRSEEGISSLIDRQFGFKPTVLILTVDDLKKAIVNNPFSAAEGKACHLYFCGEEIGTMNVEKLDALKTETEGYAVKGKVFYLYAPDGVGRSKLAANIEKCVGFPLTARNLNTALKLEQMVAS